jgi:DNA-directed RNA polymerase subunit K/omega
MNPVSITYAGISDVGTMKLGPKRRSDDDDSTDSDDESYRRDDDIDESASESDDDTLEKRSSYKPSSKPKNVISKSKPNDSDDSDEDENNSDSDLDSDDKLSDATYDDDDDANEGKNRGDDDGYNDNGNARKGTGNDDDDDDDDDDGDQDDNRAERDVLLDEDEYDNESNNENGDEKYRKINEVFRKNYIGETHPEAQSHTDDEIHALAKVVRDKNGVIVDPLHRTIPMLTKYEKTRILGIRTKQINGGAEPFVTSKINTTSDKIIDGYHIALRELEEKKLPFIISRPIPGGGTEYWYLQDLEVI